MYTSNGVEDWGRKEMKQRRKGRMGSGGGGGGDEVEASNNNEAMAEKARETFLDNK